MKHGMPRKIDDIRRNWLIGICLGLLLLATAALFGYETWMHPYRLRRERLGSVLREGKTFLSRFDESLASANPSGLNAARNRMFVLSAEAKGWATELPDFSLDVELYVTADRMTAERLLEAHSATVAEYAKGSAASRAAATEAAGLAEAIGKLLEVSFDASAAEARSDLAQSLLELQAVHSQVRPSVAAATAAEERFNASQRKAVEARARIAEWTVGARRAMADAESIEGEMATAKQRMKDAAERSRGLREEGLSLQIDQNSVKLATLQDALRKGEREVESALKAYLAAKKDADEKVGRISGKAREACETAKDSIQRLSTEHGSLLPEKSVTEGKDAAEELEAVLRKHDETWQNLSDQGAELVRRAETLRSEAGGIIVQIENARKTGQVVIDGVRASALPGELGDIRGKLASATLTLGTEGLQRQLDAIATRATAAMKAVQAAKPDIPQLLAGIRRDAAAALTEIGRIQSQKDLLESRLRDGRGASKSALEQALAACRHPAVVENELRQLKAADASTGRDIQTLRARIAKAQESVRAFAAAVGKVRQDQETAEADGRFFPVSWEEGAIGWEPGTPGVVTGQNESVLIPIYNGTEGKSYAWEFDLQFLSAGQHRIEVKVAKPNTSPVNESIDRLKRAVHDGQSVNGGWIGVVCQLKSPAGTWGDELWIPNYNKLSPSETVVEGNGMFGAGYQTFTLSMNLSASPATGNNFGWHPGRLVFTIFVDGKQVQKFWHKSR